MAEASSSKPKPAKTLNINVGVLGHVDSGKSTLMGRLLVDGGVVDQRTMSKYEKESHEVGKASFKFAWVMDQSEEERMRGVLCWERGAGSTAIGQSCPHPSQ